MIVKEYGVLALFDKLIGDSFGWGLSALPLLYSYADYLAANDIVCYNAGIISADPAQYLAIAEKYIPLLRPDFVLVNFYLGNDVVSFERKPLPGRCLTYVTNAGWLDGCPFGEYLSPQEAYEYVKGKIMIPNQEHLYNRLCALSSTGTMIWRLSAWCGLVDAYDGKFNQREQQYRELFSGKTYSHDCIKKIESVSQAYNARFLLFIMPDLINASGHKDAYNAKELFPDIKFCDGSEVLTAADYKAPSLPMGGHINNLGHQKYGKFMLEKMNEAE